MSMLQSVWQAIMRVFGVVQPPNPALALSLRGIHDGGAAAICAPPHPTQEPLPAANAKKPRAPRARELASMGDLLASLDETFAALRLPFDKLSWIRRDRVIGLRKLGVHVIHPASQDTAFMQAITVPPRRILPAMLCVSFGWSRSDNSEHTHPAVLFAVKESKLPAGVSKHAGQHYLFGAGYKVGVDSANDTHKNLLWLSGYITVRADGSLYLHNELSTSKHTINVSNPATRRAVGRTLTYTTKAWGKASLSQMYDNATRTEGDRICVNEFAIMMNWWLARADNWSVAVKKSGERITFAIPKELTARFFTNRIKVTNSNGVTKRIIHHVRSHERETAGGVTTVKEHIRGLAEFDWNGYGCRVTAPKFNGFLSTDFTLAGTVSDDDEIPSGWIDESKIGAILADLEDGRLTPNGAAARYPAALQR